MRVLLVLAMTGTASAQTIDETIPPTIRLSRASDVEIERGEVTWVSFAAPKDDAIAIDVPKGTLVVGIELRSGDRVAWGHLEERAKLDGPGALVEWDSASGEVDHLILRHVARDCSETDVVRRCGERITLALELPAIDRVRIDPKPARVDGKPARSALIAVKARAPADQPHVVEDVGLVAHVSEMRFAASREPHVQRALDKQIIRRRFAIHEAQLRRCYTSARQHKPELSGTVVLHFLIAPDGSVSDLAVDGAVEDAHDCLVHEVSQWDFPPTDETVRVNFPLTFRPSE